MNQANGSDTRADDISVEETQNLLLKYDLTIADVADIISSNSLKQSCGTIKTKGQEIRTAPYYPKYPGTRL